MALLAPDQAGASRAARSALIGGSRLSLVASRVTRSSATIFRALLLLRGCLARLGGSRARRFYRARFLARLLNLARLRRAVLLARLLDWTRLELPRLLDWPGLLNGAGLELPRLLCTLFKRLRLGPGIARPAAARWGALGTAWIARSAAPGTAVARPLEAVRSGAPRVLAALPAPAAGSPRCSASDTDRSGAGPASDDRYAKPRPVPD